MRDKAHIIHMRRAAAAVVEELTLLASQLTLTEFAASSGSCRRADNPHGSDPPPSNFPVDRFENRAPPGLYRYRGSHLAVTGAPPTPPVPDGPGGSAIEKNTRPRVPRAGVSFGKLG